MYLFQIYMLCGYLLDLTDALLQLLQASVRVTDALVSMYAGFAVAKCEYQQACRGELDAG
jgi:hypothetical protein